MPARPHSICRLLRYSSSTAPVHALAACPWLLTLQSFSQQPRKPRCALSTLYSPRRPACMLLPILI